MAYDESTYEKEFFPFDSSASQAFKGTIFQIFQTKCNACIAHLKCMYSLDVTFLLFLNLKCAFKQLSLLNRTGK